MNGETDLIQSQESWFTMVEVEINSHCNRKCIYCPNSLVKQQVPKWMDDGVYERILGELVRVNFSGRLSYHFYGEPLLHPRLDTIVERTSTALPKVRQVLYTNGDFLTEDRYSRLRNLGIAHFVVTSHDSIPFPSRPDQTVLFPSDLHLTNRGGVLWSIPGPLKLRCFAPSTMLIITISGDVVLCYEDVNRTQCMGNMMRQPLEEVWFSTRFSWLRQQLAAGNRNATGICRRCDNKAHQVPDTFDYVL
jgi:2-deoxy-scyllo-inosamine dehydrogenase (SAM-dependent)